MMDATQLALEQRAAEEQRHHAKGQFLWVWAALLVMTGIEVYLAYQNMELIRMLVDPDGPVAHQGGADHRLLHAHEV